MLQAQIGQASEHEVSLTHDKSKREVRKLLGIGRTFPAWGHTTSGAYRAASKTLALFVEEV